MKISVYNISGDKVKDLEVSQRVFGVKTNPNVVHQIVVAQDANARVAIAHTKTKGEVRGGGKKPWKQKGTGRARHGSSRSPLWVGGGVTFGPRSDRNFSQKVNQKQKQKALFMCLSEKVSSDALVVFEQLKLSAAKTKELNNWLKSLKAKIASMQKAKKVLLVLDKNNPELTRAALNLTGANTILADSLNVKAVLLADAVLASEKALQIIERHYHKLKEPKIKTAK